MALDVLGVWVDLDVMMSTKHPNENRLYVTQDPIQLRLGIWIMSGLWLSGNILFFVPSPRVPEVSIGQVWLQKATQKAFSTEQISGDFDGHFML